MYADECFLRVYDGKTGDVLFSSYRTSGTWLENPVIADVDKDDNTEIVVNSANSVVCPAGGTLGVPYVDPLHKGVRCDDDMGCVGGATCGDGYCRCATNEQCKDGKCKDNCTCECCKDGSCCKHDEAKAGAMKDGCCKKPATKKPGLTPAH